MEFSMKKGSPWRIRKFPWVVYTAAVVLSLILVIVKTLLTPDLLPLPYVFLWIVVGIAVGLFYISAFLKKENVGKGDYLAAKNGMISVWVVSSICVLITFVDANWAYLLGLFLLGMSFGYFPKYIPRYIEIREQIAAGGFVYVDKKKKKKKKS